MKKKICGVGVNDADYPVRSFYIDPATGGKKRMFCPFYRVWASMIERVYSDKVRQKYPSYYGCSVHYDWLLFSNFKSWMETQDWGGKELDKDLLIPGNKVYGPDTCVFVTSHVNTFVIECNASRGKYPIGVHYHKRREKFVASIRNQFTKKLEHIGYYNTTEEAHRAWGERKLELARKLASEQSDVRISNALIERYSKYA